MDDSRWCHKLLRRCLKFVKHDYAKGELHQLKGSLFDRRIQEFKVGKDIGFMSIYLFFFLLHELHYVEALWVYCGLSVCVVLKSAFNILGCSPTRVCVCVRARVLLLSKHVCVLNNSEKFSHVVGGVNVGQRETEPL